MDNLSSEQIDLELIDACPVCGALALEQFYSELEDHEEGVSGSWRMSRCTGCHSLLLNPRPRPESLSSTYRTYYTHLEPDAENHILHAEGKIPAVIRGYLLHRFGLQAGPTVSGFRWLVTLAWPLRQQLDYFMRHLPKQPGCVLDIGCGSGGFLKRAADARWSVVGIEPDPTAAAVARKYSKAEVFESIEHLESGNFDVVTLAHVIEHVYSPQEIITKCMRALKPGGRLWLATPNINSLGHKLYCDAWQPLETPRHLVMPTAAMLCKILTDAGFADVKVLRRGRGSLKRVRASALRASRLGRRRGFPLALSILIDLAASLLPRAGEELVIVGTKPVE